MPWSVGSSPGLQDHNGRNTVVNDFQIVKPQTDFWYLCTSSTSQLWVCEMHFIASITPATKTAANINQMLVVSNLAIMPFDHSVLPHIGFSTLAHTWTLEVVCSTLWICCSCVRTWAMRRLRYHVIATVDDSIHITCCFLHWSSWRSPLGCQLPYYHTSQV